jgi:murein DD-endopeptidase MepM/ murein hydrolase activator NlpD
MDKLFKPQRITYQFQRIFFIILIFVWAASILSGCQISPEEEPPPPVSTEIPPSETPSKPTDTQVSLNLATITATTEPISSPTPFPVLPTPDFSIHPIEQTIHTWRPPVYPIPWVPSPQDHFYFSNPITAFDIEDAFFIYRYGDVFFDDVVHTGIDIPGDMGTPILAVGDGKIVYAGQGIYRGGNDIFDDPYGKAVVIEHSFNYQGEPLFTLYAHLDEILVSVGDSVRSGQKIGLMGVTGQTTGPHLHFEVRLGDNDYFSTKNPELWLSPPIGWGILVGQVLTYEGRLLEQQLVYLYRSDDDLKGDEMDDHIWIGKSYQNEAINRDPYYSENLTISNIPAGTYVVSIPITNIGFAYKKMVEIKPGQVTFFRFNVWRGFSNSIPPTPNVFFSPNP